MLESQLPYRDLAQNLIEVSKEAAHAILEVYNSQEDIGIETKSDNSPVTRADIAANSVIEKQLRALTPDIPILTEESSIANYDQRKTWQRYWLVDPLDGTKEFINRNDQFTINIALIEKNTPVLGVVYIPVTHIVYLGIVNEGAFKVDAQASLDAVFEQGNRIQCRSISALENTPVNIVASINHSNPATDTIVDKIEHRVGPTTRQAIGSSLKFCLLAEGVADVYPRAAPTSEWDTGAAQAVLEAAGGGVYTMDLKPLRYNTKESLLNPHFIALADTHYDWSFLTVS